MASCSDGNSAPDDEEVEPDAGPRAEPPDAAPKEVFKCDDGFINVEDPETGNCFMLFNTAGSWAEAVDGCEAVGGDAFLAAPRTASENASADSAIGNREVWIGATDEAVEGIWEWVDGEENTFTNWRGGEPSNNDDLEHCLVLEGDRGGSWDDRECTENHEYVCERARQL